MPSALEVLSLMRYYGVPALWRHQRRQQPPAYYLRSSSCAKRQCHQLAGCELMVHHELTKQWHLAPDVWQPFKGQQRLGLALMVRSFSSHGFVLLALLD